MNKKSKVVFSIIAALTCLTYAERSLYIGFGPNVSMTSLNHNVGSVACGPDSTYEISVQSNLMRLSKLGNVSIYFEQGLSDKFSILTGVSLEMRGETEKWTKKISEFNDSTRSSDNLSLTDEIAFKEFRNMSYLQIPIQAQFGMKFGPFKFNVFAGPELGIALNNKSYCDTTKTTTVYDGSNSPAKVTNGTDTVDNSSKLTMLDAGLSGGAGIEIRAWSGAFFLRGAVYQGLVDVYDSKRIGRDDSKTGLHTNGKLMVGYKFDLPDLEK